MLDYTKRAKNYDKRWQHYCLPSFSKSIKIIDLHQASKLLDVGCGTGIFLEILEKKYPSALLYGIDPNQAMLEKERERERERLTISHFTQSIFCSPLAFLVGAMSALGCGVSSDLRFGFKTSKACWPENSAAVLFART